MARQLKPVVFILEGINAFATTFFYFYLFFYMRERFGFGDRANLCLAALNGFIYAIAAWQCGRFTQRRGYAASLRTGFVLMIGALVVGSQLESAAGLFGVMMVWTIGTCFTWPALEALPCEGESPRGVQRMVGIYNIVWAAGGAVAYFVGGAVIEKLGMRSLFWLPVSLHVAQLALLEWAQRQTAPRVLETGTETRGRADGAQLHSAAAPPGAEIELNPRPIAKARLFLRLAWIGNPFAYIAIHAIAPVIPTVAERLKLTPMFAGFFCSIWFFARLGAFVWLWLWPGWHYRFRWFIASYVALVACFLVILLATSLWVLLVAQLVFGLGLGLIYYSSLYYSMDAGDTKAEHSGLHEAAIGIGICAGPAVSAAALWLSPATANAGAWTVGGLLVCGLAALLTVKLQDR